jgi:sugar phosphate isomerase/epimerase
MKLAFSTNAYKRYDLFTAIDSIADIGYQGVEIMCDIPHAYPPNVNRLQREVIRQRLKKNNIKISNLNAFMLFALGDTWHPSFIEPEETERQKRIDHTIDCIDLAADLGAPFISIEPGGPLEGMDRDWALEVYREAVEIIGEHAERKGVTVLIEPEPDLLIEKPDQFLSFMEGIVSPTIGLNFDIGHFYCAGEDPAALVSVLAPYTRHYHLEDIAATRVHRHLIPGEGAIDFKSVLAAISDTGFEGFVTIELYPYEESPVPAATRAREHILPILNEVMKQNRPLRPLVE